MKKNSNLSGKIAILDESVSRKIAAGEIIERPASVVRELLDNSIDAESSEIELHIKNGGISSIRVIDNGNGMSREDLELCYLPHATSKLKDFDDIYRIESLGFRGEALSSIAACSRMDIITSTGDNPANKLVIHNNKLLSLDQSLGNKGTVISVNDLFFSIPARKKFLKRTSAETAKCKGVFIEKSSAFPDISFKLFVNDELKLFLPPSDLRERIFSIYSGKLKKDLLYELSCNNKGFSIKSVAARPELSFRDRKLMQIFVNGRRINDFSFIQAAEYGYSEFLPGGSYPGVFIFIKIDPELVDFNIHPAKSEVRIKIQRDVHHEIVLLLKDFLKKFQISRKEKSYSIRHESFGFVSEARPGVEPAIRITEWSQKTDSVSRLHPVEDKKDFFYIGQLFSLFLLVEYKDSLFMIDQHAAHEKILFEKYASSPPIPQNLLIPVDFKITEKEKNTLSENIERYEKLGIIVNLNTPHLCRITALPRMCTGMEDDIIEFLKQGKGTESELKLKLYSALACKAAIKEGEQIDPVTAEELIEKTFKLENARCPHGRPVWHSISRTSLNQLVKRT